MHTVIFNPTEEFQNRYKHAHSEKTTAFFNDLVKRSGIDIEANRETLRRRNDYIENLGKLKKALGWWKFLRVLMCITLVLIPLVILKITPKIRALKKEVEEADKRAEELLEEAENQMFPLNALFTKRDSLDIIEAVIPLISFDPFFSVKQEVDMIINYDFEADNTKNETTIDVLAGRYNGNPFLYEDRRIHTMGTETYRGEKTIQWTETFRDVDGKLRTITKTQVLQASVTKPKPFYNTQVILHYCAQGGPDLSFSRDASGLDQKSDKEINRIIKRGEKKLKKKSDKAISQNADFTAMSNSNFEIMFDALDRNDEVQFRTLFTPLAQTNMTELIRSKIGYGDDFDFIKSKRTNRIVSNHSQRRSLVLHPSSYTSYSFDVIKNNFIQKNIKFFKDVYFDFAPLLAIPLYQERPVHSLKPIPANPRSCSMKECEVLANIADFKYVAHPSTKTEVILKVSYVGTKDGFDEIRVTAYSYDIVKRVDHIPVYGGDGRFHHVPVMWDEYIPLETQHLFYVSTVETAENQPIIAKRNGLCLFQI